MMLFWTVFDMYVAFFADVCICSSRTLSPASILNRMSSLKLPLLTSSLLYVASSRWPRSAMFCRPQSNTVEIIDFKISLFALIRLAIADSATTSMARAWFWKVFKKSSALATAVWWCFNFVVSLAFTKSLHPIPHRLLYKTTQIVSSSKQTAVLAKHPI